MNKRSLRRIQRKLSPFSGWYFLLIAVLLFSVAAFALRQNNIRMLELREQVFIADEQGEDIEESLRALREHVHSHMNTDLTANDTAIKPPIQLQYTYQRLRDAEEQKTRTANERIYQDAEDICEARFPAGRLANGRVQCVEEYILSNGVAADPVPKELYQFDFVSPRWSPDVAGLSLVLGVLFLLLFIVKFLLDWWIKTKLKAHQ